MQRHKHITFFKKLYLLSLLSYDTILSLTGEYLNDTSVLYEIFLKKKMKYVSFLNF